MPLGAGLAFQEGIAADEIIVFGLEGNGETDSRFERVGLIAELVPGEDQPCFNAEHVKGFQTQRGEPLGATSLPDSVPHLRGVVWMAEDLEPQLTGVASAGQDDRNTLRSADPCHREAEPSQFSYRGLVGAGPDDVAEDLPAQRTLDLQVVELVGGVPDPGPQSTFLGLLT